MLDLGRRPEARFTPGEEVLLDREVIEDDIAYVVEHIGAFGDDNRAGIERTLHRITAIRNRAGKVVGLTCRIGRAVFGTIDIIRDIVESGQSILLLGRPGVGKTTMLREVARVLADDLGKRVIIVDTSNEIAGDGDIPHPGIGDARRMQVPHPDRAARGDDRGRREPHARGDRHRRDRHRARGRAPRAPSPSAACSSSAPRTATRSTTCMLNPTLSDLVGGIQTVTLGDEEARRRGTQKTVLERKAPPTFDVLVEIVERDSVIVHRNVAETVDAILRGHMVPPESRLRTEGGELKAMTKYDYRISETAAGNPAFAPLEPTGGFGHFSRGAAAQGGRFAAGSGGSLRPLPGRGAGSRGLRPLPGERISSAERQPAADDRFVAAPDSDPRRQLEQALRDADVDGESAGVGRPVGASRPTSAAGRAQRPMVVFPFGVSRKRLEQAVRELGVPVTVGRELEESDAVVTLRNYYKRKPGALRDAESHGVPIYVLKTNTMLQMENMLASLFDLEADPSEAALRETSEAIGLVAASGRPMELSPQNAYIRRLQHQMAERNNLMSRSRGAEPNRRVELLPDEGRAWR